jgi:hypothetical protein
MCTTTFRVRAVAIAAAAAAAATAAAADDDDDNAFRLVAGAAGALIAPTVAGGGPDGSGIPARNCSTDAELQSFVSSGMDHFTRTLKTVAVTYDIINVACSEWALVSINRRPSYRYYIQRRSIAPSEFL